MKRRALFVDSFAPPILEQHLAIDAALDSASDSAIDGRLGDGGSVQVVVDAAPTSCPLPQGVRTRLLRTIHPEATVERLSGAFRGGLQPDRFPVHVTEATAAVRRDPVANWDLFHEHTKALLTVRVCCVGAESTGKTTLVGALAQRHNTHQIHEYGRGYTVEKQQAGTNDHWTTSDFVEIAEQQQRLEDAAAVGAGPLLFCDTDAMTTALWHERYQGSVSAEVVTLGRMRTYDLFVLCDVDIPWERDDIRLGENTRGAMHTRFLHELQTQRAEPWILVSGTVEERVDRVNEAVVALGLLQPSSMYRPSRFRQR